jgi:hypothetical protein
MPTNWQEIFVTLVAACALIVLVRPFAPYPLGPRRSRGSTCAACAAGQAAKTRGPGASAGRAH